MSLDREELVQKAKMADLAGRQEDMMSMLKSLAETGVDLTNEERNLLSAAYKNVIGARRSSWRIISTIEQKTEGQQMVVEYKDKIENELRELCYDVLGLCDRFLIPKASNAENKVFYLKMKGDHYRYLAEVATGDARRTDAEEAQKAYQIAFDICKTKMEPSHPVRLGLTLNFSVFYYEILNCPDRACQLGRQAIEDLKADLDSLSEDPYKDSTLIMQLLQENLTMWSATVQADRDQAQEGHNN